MTECVEDSSTKLGYKLTLAGYAGSILKNLHPSAIPPSMRSTYRAQINNSPHQRRTRRSRRFDSSNATSKRQRIGDDVVTATADIQATTKERIDETEMMPNNNDNNQSTNEELGGNANGEEEEIKEQRECDSNKSPVAEDITPAVSWTNSTEEMDDNNDTDASSRKDVADMSSSGHTAADTEESMATIELSTITQSFPPVPLVEDPIVVDIDMTRQTNPEMACVTFNDGNKNIICCTREKMDESTFIVNGKQIVVIEGLYSGRSTIPEERIINTSGRLSTDLTEDLICKELVASSAALAMHTTTVLLVCEDAVSFGDVASIVASFYLLFRNLDVNTCLYRIQRAFCDQCPSSFGRSYVMQGLAKKVSALCRIQQATDFTVLVDKDVGCIVGEVYEGAIPPTIDEDSSVFRSNDELFAQLRESERKRGCYDLREWIGPEESYNNNNNCHRYHF